MSAFRPAPIFTLIRRWYDEPLPILRLEIIRVLAPLAVLGFMSGRILHADELLGMSGFHVPDLGHEDWRQVLYVPPLPNAIAFLIAIVMFVSGVATSLGFLTRASAFVFAVTLAFVALADRMAAFTVSKLSPVVMLAIATSPAGTRLSLDWWFQKKADPSYVPPDEVPGGLRFFQLFLPVMYCASGLAKANGDWLRSSHVVWSHLHDSYQTWFSYLLVSTMPAFAWVAFQWVTLIFETGAPIWFLIPKTRGLAFVMLFGMHVMIGLMFGPVIWFAILMMSMLLGAYAPDVVIARLDAWVSRFDRPVVAPSKKRKKKKRKKKRAPEASADGVG